MGQGWTRISRRLGGLSREHSSGAQAPGLSATRRRQLYRTAKAICRSAQERADTSGVDADEEVRIALLGLEHDTDMSFDEYCEVERYCMREGFLV